MAISISGTPTAVNGDTGVIPSDAADGSFMLACASRTATSLAPSLDASWTNIPTAGAANSVGLRLAYRFKQPGDVAPTFTNAQAVVIAAYTGVDSTTPVGATAQTGGTGATLTIPGVTLTNTAGSSWVLAGYAHRDTTTLDTPPGMVERGEVAINSRASATSGTGGGVTSFPGTSITVTLAGVNSPAGWRAMSVELLAAAGGATNYNGTATTSSTTTVSSAGVVGKVATAAVAATVAVAAAGVVGTGQGGTVSEAASVTATGQVGTSTGASVAATATVTAAGAVSAPGSSSAAVTATASVTATGSVASSRPATIPVTASLTASGIVGTSRGASLPVAATITASGAVTSTRGATVTSTVAITAAGSVAGSAPAAPAPDSRTYAIAAESRLYVIPAEQRTLEVT